MSFRTKMFVGVSVVSIEFEVRIMGAWKCSAPDLINFSSGYPDGRAVVAIVVTYS